MSKYSELYTTPVPQSEPLDERQVENNAGGYVYTIDCWSRLDRFLILGSDSQTYYQSARALTKQNAACVLECLGEDPARCVTRVVEISDEGRAPKNDPAIFVLALGACHADEKTRQLAMAAVPKVCRTSTHLFMFVSYARDMGKGWGRAMKRTVANWYDQMPVDRLAYQVIKYRNRESYTHKRMLQCAHPSGGFDEDPMRIALYRWVCGKEHDVEQEPELITAHMQAMANPKLAREMVTQFNLPWEALPTECLRDPEIWRAALPKMGLTALIRNLGNMTEVGALAPMSDANYPVLSRLADDEQIRAARVHPFTVLQAMAVYASGHGVRGSKSWQPITAITDALDDAFYKAFANVEPTGAQILLALDVSGSMGSPIMGSPLSCREASAALALVTMSTEANTHVVGFTAKAGGHWYRGAELTPLQISPRQRLTDAVKAVSDLRFGGTDCALPMLYAMREKLDVDAFLIFTDNETWAGETHPVEALRKYRAATGIDAKLVVVGMTSTGFSIADPNDSGMLDVVGFDSACPALISDFIRA